nr:hypothetical protein [Neorhizobium tomejilense]
MSDTLVDRISEIREAGEADILRELQSVLAAAAGGSLTVKAARDTFTKVLGRVRGGEIQLIGRKTEDQTVVISLKDLAALIASGARAQSFGSALDEVGFKPLGRRIKVRSGVNSVPLNRPATKSARSRHPSL